MIYALNTGYKPEEELPSAIEKRNLFNQFAKTRFMLRKMIYFRHSIEDSLEQWKLAVKHAKKTNDFRLFREANEKISTGAEWLANNTYEKELAGTLLDSALWIDKIATIDEKATLLGLSTIAARRALKPFSDTNEPTCESFTLLMTHMPKSHPDPDIENSISEAIINTIFANPIAHRKVRQQISIITGEDLPPPDVPSPQVVKSIY